MPLGLAENGKQLAKKGILAQCILSLVLLVAVLIIQPEYTIAVLLGALSYIIPHSFLAYWSFRYAGATKNKLVVQSFSQGLRIKLALTVIFFAVGFFYFNTHPFPLLGAYATAMVCQSTTMFYLSRRS